MLLSKSDLRRFHGLTILGLLLVSVFVGTLIIHPIYGGNGDWWNYSWQYRKSITINHTKVASDITSFPVLIDMTDTDLPSKAQDDGDDIAFTDYSGNKLDHEIELYDNSTGHLTAWVRVPDLSSTEDTILYMYYGNSAASSQENPAGVWNHYVMVQHLEETGGTHFDSTVNGNDGSPQGGLDQSAVGKVDGADSFDGGDDYVDVGSDSSIDDINQITVTAWIKLDVAGVSHWIFDKGWTSGKSFYVHSANMLCFAQGFTSGSPNPYGWWKSPTNVVTAGSWYHVAVTYDASSSGNDPIFYVNGILVSTTEGNTPSGTALSDASYNGTMGGAVSLNLYMDGVIDEFRVSELMRSADWISTEYTNQLNPGTFYNVGSEEERVIPEEPWLNDEYPSDGATDVELNPTLSIHAVDFQGDSMTILFRTNASGSWQTIGTKTGYNGTYTQTTTNMNGYSIRYCWRACASDGTHWTNETYSFTTRPAPPAWWNYYWRYRKNITIDHTKVAAGLTNFPVLINITDTDLASNAQPNGDDIAFADHSGNKLDHEIELFNGTSGRLVAWVRVPNLSGTVDTVIFMYYGNSAASNQENPTGVWDSNYKMVEHLEETGGTHFDSTAYGNDGSPQGGLNQSAVGKVDGADDFDGSDDYVDVGSKASINDINQITISAWIKPDSWGEGYPPTGAGYIYDKGFTSGKALYIYNSPEGLHFIHGFSSHYGWWHGGTFAFDGSWYFVAVTFDNTNTANDPMMYINGVPVSIVEGDAPVGTAVSDAGFSGYIGSNQDGSRNFDGTIDELHISDTIRTSDWILTEYNNQFSPSTFYTVGSEEERVVPEEPFLSDEYPSDGAIDVMLNPTLSIDAVDFQGDSMTILFRTNATGPWQTIGTKTGYNGTYTQTTTEMDSYSTKYYWKVCASDVTHWTNETYTFTTRPENYAPSVSSPSPQDGATGVGFNPLLSVDVNDLDGESMTIMFGTNVTGSWQVIGTKTGGNGRYNQTTTGMDEYGKTYHWKVNVTDGKTWTNETYAFTTWTTEDLYKQIGYCFSAGLPYAGESKDKDTFYIIWYASEDIYPWPPTEDERVLYYAEFNRKTGWVNGTVLYSSWLCNWSAVSGNQSCPSFGYFGDEYHVFWTTADGYLWHLNASEWSDFQSMTGGWSNFSGYLGDIEPWGSVYAFNNSYAITFLTRDYADRGHTIVYWVWNETSGWSDMIPINSTSTGGHSHYPHDCSGPVLLPINSTTWYLYYKSDVGGDHFNIVKTFDAGQTWGTPAIADIPDQPHWRSHRPAFVRYGDNFYMIVNVGGSDISCYNSTDGEHWGNLTTMHSGSWYVPNGVMLDQRHILWTASGLGWYPDTMTGDEYGGVFEIPEMIANPGEPSDPYPSNCSVLAEGTTNTSLRVKVHGNQTYDVAFYWANGTFIGEDKLLREGDVASVEVSGLKDDETYQWYSINRGTTYGYWGNEPDPTSDENRSDTWSFGVLTKPKLELIPCDVTCRKYCENFTIVINVTRALNVEDFEFEIHYNTTLLDYVDVIWSTWGSGTITVDEVNGNLTGYTSGSPTSGNLTLVTIEFHAAYHHIWKDCPGWTNNLTGTIYIQWANLSYPGIPDLRYERGVLYEIDVGPDVICTFSPIQGDMDNDGDVDIMDLRTAAAFYNVEEGDTNWTAASTYDLNCDKIIDIFDLVIIAVNYDYKYDC